MNYLVFCTFDLKNASSKDYETAYSDLHALGLQKVQKADNGTNVVIPTTSAMGSFDGSSAGSVRDTMCNRIQAAFKARGFKSEIFLVVGGDWAWGGRTT
jgi:hypothetical protein